MVRVVFLRFGEVADIDLMSVPSFHGDDVGFSLVPSAGDFPTLLRP